MKHVPPSATECVVKRSHADQPRRLRVSQTLIMALFSGVLVFGACSMSGASWLFSSVAAITTLNAVPLMLSLILAAR